MATETVNITTTLADDSVTNAKLANMTEATFKGRKAGVGTGDPQDMDTDSASFILDTATDPFVRTSVLPTIVEEDPGPGVGLIESGAGVSPIVLKNLKNGAGTKVTNNTGSVQVDIDFTAADRYYYSDVSALPVEGTITSAGRDLLDDSNAAAQRTTLGLGTLATQNGTFSGTSSGTNTGDQDLSPYQTIAALAADVRAVVLTGLSLASSAAVAATDSILAAFGKLQAFNNLFTTAGLAIARLANPGAETFLRINADNTATARSASEMRTDLGLGTAALLAGVAGAEAAYTGTPTFTAGAAPSGASSLRQFYTQVGNHVEFQISLTYATTGTTVTNVTLTFPTEFPTPAIPTGFTGANAKIAPMTGRTITTPTGTTASIVPTLVRNAGDTAFEIQCVAFTSGSYRSFIFSGSYFTA